MFMKYNADYEDGTPGLGPFFFDPRTTHDVRRRSEEAPAMLLQLPLAMLSYFSQSLARVQVSSMQWGVHSQRATTSKGPFSYM